MKEVVELEVTVPGSLKAIAGRPVKDPYPQVKIFWVPKGRYEFIVKIMGAKPNPDRPGTWKYFETGWGIRFHGNKRGVQCFAKKVKGVRVVGAKVMMRGDLDNLKAAIDVALANFVIK